jgi:mannuronan synthase
MDGKMSNTGNIVHEAESQRQHVRVQLPAKVEIDNNIYETKDWSVNSVCFKTPNASAFKERHVYSINLLFSMDSFELVVPMSLEVRHVNAKEGTIGGEFENMTTRQISIMQHLVSAYVKGEITNVNDMIHVVGRNNMANPRKIPEAPQNMTRAERIKIKAQKMVIPVLATMLALYLMISAYEQAFIVSANSAVVSGNASVVRATSSGIVSFKEIRSGDKVARGEAIVTITSDGNVVKGIDSDCDCFVQEMVANSGDLVQSGDPLLKIVASNSPLYVEAKLNYEKAVNVTKGMKAYIIIAGMQIPATVRSISAQNSDTGISVAIIQPDTEIPSDFVGAPADVKIDTVGWTN